MPTSPQVGLTVYSQQLSLNRSNVFLKNKYMKNLKKSF